MRGTFVGGIGLAGAEEHQSMEERRATSSIAAHSDIIDMDSHVHVHVACTCGCESPQT